MFTCAGTPTILGLVLLVLVFSVEACLKYIRIPIESESPEGIWKEESNLREVADCECGIIPSGYLFRPWNVYIHAKFGDGPNDVIVCSGTIITSNLVATSHTCLMYPEKNTSVYDAWRVEDSVAKKTLIPITSIYAKAVNLEGEEEVFLVEAIMFSQHYALNEMVKIFPKDNLALLRLSADFTEHDFLRPACIPTPEDMVYIEAFEQQLHYYSSVELLPGKWLIQEEPAEGGLYRGRYCGTAPYYKDDNETIRRLITSKDDRTFCIRIGSQSTFVPHEKSLVIPSYDKDGWDGNIRGFLLGIHVQSRSRTSDDDKSLHFSSITALNDYIEYQAKIHKSRWCRQPALSHLQPRTILVPPPIYMFGPWFWDFIPFISPIVRDESLECVCGLRNDNGEISPQVVGGAPAPPYVYGWMTLLQVKVYNGEIWGKAGCGASIINDRVILTAAHCTASINRETGLVEESPPELFIVEVNLYYRYRDRNRVKLEVKEIITHPGYFSSAFRPMDYDVALIILEKPLNFVQRGESGIRPVCLPTLGKPIHVVGKTGTLIGWGLTNHTYRSIPDLLQIIDLPVQDLRFCHDVEEKYGIPYTTDRFICIGDLNPWKNAAKGDSGGPFVIVNSTTKQHTQVGLVSHAYELHGGPDNESPGVRVHVVLFLDVQRALPFIDYFSDRAGAKWCKSS